MNLCDLDVAEIYLHVERPAEAVMMAKRAIHGFSKNEMRYEHAKALAFASMALSQIGKAAEAEQAAADSRKLFEKEGNKYWISVTD